MPVSPGIPQALRVARRTLEEVHGVRIEEDWVLDAPHVWRLQVDLTPEDLGTEFEVPRTSRWFVLVPDGYPKGQIDIHPAVTGGVSGIFPHERPTRTRPDAPYEGAKICVATDSENNLRRDAQVEPRSTEDRLAWHINRALGWIEKASKGTLLAPGDPFELPVFDLASTELFVFREGHQDLAAWASVDVDLGYADLRRLDVRAESIWAVTAFRTLGSKVLIQPAWGTWVAAGTSERRVGLWIRIPRLPFRSPYAAPATWQELSDALNDQGLTLNSILKLGTERFHDGYRHPLLIGFPVPERVGEAPRQMHWIPIDLPFLERRAPSGFRQNELGLWFASLHGTFRPTAPVQWAESQNWHPDELATRGRLPSDLTAARILLIGAGALGSVVGELLVRAGVTHITVVDGERLVAGNLVRHTLTADQLRQFKADAVAARLNVASPNVVAIAEPKLAEMVVGTTYLAGFELVIDTTGDRRILELLAEVPGPQPLTYVSVAVTLHARRLVAYLSRGTTFPLSAFDAAFEPYRQEELERDEERPMEGIGCWHPVFPARADEMALMACTAVGLLNDAWPIGEGASALHVFERLTDDRGRFRGVARISP